MAFIVEMARGRPDAPGFATFDCSLWAWQGLLSIAQTFGWKPMGTVKDPSYTGDEEYERGFAPNYKPEEWRYCKRVSDADAANLARALRRAASAIQKGSFTAPQESQPALLKDGMTAEEFQRANQAATGVLEAFAGYCEHGGFAFAFDD